MEKTTDVRSTPHKNNRRCACNDCQAQRAAAERADLVESFVPAQGDAK